MADREIFNRKSLLSAIEGWYAGNLTELDAYRLKEQLRTSSESRQIFVEYGDLLASLEMNSCCENPEAVDSFLSSALLAEERANRRFLSWGVAVLAVLILALSPLVWILSKGNSSRHHFADGSEAQGSQGLGHKITIPVPPETPVRGATLVELTEQPQPWPDEIAGDGESSATQIPWAIGDSILTGQVFSLQGPSRYARLRLESGAVVILESPSEIRLLSTNAVELRSGRIVGMVPPEATGFLVFTEYGVVRDIGTEFAVCVHEQNMFVSVLSGLVECMPRAETTGEILATSVPLVSGEHLKLSNVPSEIVKTPRSHADLEGVVCYHRRIQTSGDVRFLAGRPPLAKKDAAEYQGAICLFEETKNIPVTWNPESQSLRFSKENVPPEMLSFWAEEVAPDHVAESLQNASDPVTLSVDSYLVNLQSPDKRTIIRSGDIVFGREVIAVFRSEKTLSVTDWVSHDIEFPRSWKVVGPEARGSNEGNDNVVVQQDQISMELQASGAGDQMRIFVRSADSHSQSSGGRVKNQNN